MRDKNKFDDEEFEVEFEEDIDESGRDSSENMEEKNEESEDDFRVDFDYDDFVDDSDADVKLTKNQIINRVMAGLGVAIAGFTIFYGIVVYGMINGNKNENKQNTEPETTLQQEESKEQQEGEFFVSKNSDENISQEVKDLLNGEKMSPIKTGLSKVDKEVDEIIALTCKDNVTTYDNVRNIYDYMMYYYKVKSTSYVDSDTVYEYCSSMNYVSEYDMELVYRAGKLFKDKAGDSKDYACGFTLLLRKLGLEAYYIDGKKTSEYGGYSSHGYTVVMLDDEMYIFDVAEEDTLSGDIKSDSGTEKSNELTSENDNNENNNSENNKQEDTGKVEYKVFCKSFDELKDMYSDDGVEDSISSFEEFKTLGKLSFSAKATTDGGDYTSASVSYSANDNVAVLDNLTIDLYDNVYFEGSVSGSKKNTWKLIVRVYDDDMNYITESTLYNETTNSSENEVTYRAGRAGYMKLLYIVTDENGRTCTASTTVKVNEPYDYNTTEETSEEETTKSNTASKGQLS